MVAVRTPYWLCFFSMRKGPSQSDNQLRQQEVQGEPTNRIYATLLDITSVASWLSLVLLSEYVAYMNPAGPSAVHEVARNWELQPIGAVQTKQRLVHVRWNPSIPSWAAFSCEDGSLYRVDVAQEVCILDTPQETRCNFERK